MTTIDIEQCPFRLMMTVVVVVEMAIGAHNHNDYQIIAPL